jgi:hypothetical protein
MHPLRRSVLTLATLLLGAPAVAQTSPSSGQLNLPPGAPPKPSAVPYAPPKPDSPVVQTLVGGNASGPLVVRKRASRRVVAHSHHHHYVSRVPRDLERPALAGVTLLQPLPPAPQPPHIAVPLPAYPLDTIAAAFTTPPPPIVCHPTRRIRDLPDPELYRERTLVCEPDNP